MDDEQLFRQAMLGVKPLRQDKVDIQPIQSLVDPIRRRKAAIAERSEDNALSDAVQLVDNDAVVSFKRPGMQQQMFKKLRLGKYESQARLDLHGLQIEQARAAVYEFILACQREALRTVIIVHGKGQRSATGEALLKSHTVHWLEQMQPVMAFHSAQARHGGAGAVYVLLRKNDKAKQADDAQQGDR